VSEQRAEGLVSRHRRLFPFSFHAPQEKLVVSHVAKALIQASTRVFSGTDGAAKDSRSPIDQTKNIKRRHANERCLEDSRSDRDGGDVSSHNPLLPCPLGAARALTLSARSRISSRAGKLVPQLWYRAAIHLLPRSFSVMGPAESDAHRSTCLSSSSHHGLTMLVLAATGRLAARTDADADRLHA
jgi:hypothetical protein